VGEIAATALVARVAGERTFLEPEAKPMEEDNAPSHANSSAAASSSSTANSFRVPQGFATKQGSREKAEISGEVREFFEELYQRGVKADGSSNRGQKVSGPQAAELMQNKFDRSEWLDAKECRAMFSKIGAAKRAEQHAKQRHEAEHAVTATVAVAIGGRSGADLEHSARRVDLAAGGANLGAIDDDDDDDMY